MGFKHNIHKDYDCKIFGEALRNYRLNLGWTAKQLALSYSEAIGREDEPIAVTYVYRLEAGLDMLADKSRRALLARLVGMPFTLAGVSLLTSNEIAKSEHVDTKEYENMLEIYCDTWQRGTTYKVVQDIKKRISALETDALYGASSKKVTSTELLCGYQMLAADLAAERNTLGAVPILSQTIHLSQHMNISYMYAYALRQRAGAYISTFEETRDFTVLKSGLEDFQAAEIVHASISPFYQGLVDIRRGLVYAYLAQDQSDFIKALHIIDSSSQQIDKQSEDTHIAAKLDVERYMFNRAAAYLYSPQGSPTLALKELDQVTDLKPSTSPRRGVHRDLLYAETYVALKNYPMATACIANAIEVSSEDGMDTLFNRLESVYQELRKSTYGNDLEVARVGVQILKAHHPEVFV